MDRGSAFGYPAVLRSVPGNVSRDVTRADWAPFAHVELAPGSPGWTPPATNGPVPGSREWCESLGEEARAMLKPTAAAIAAIIIGVGVLVAAFAAYFGGIAFTSNQLQNGTWYRTSDSIILALDFDGSNIDYDAEMYLPFLGNQTVDIADLDYRVIAPGVIQTHLSAWGEWRTISVSIEGDVLTMSPALTSSDADEYWFR